MEYHNYQYFGGKEIAKKKTSMEILTFYSSGKIHSSLQSLSGQLLKYVNKMST